MPFIPFESAVAPSLGPELGFRSGKKITTVALAEALPPVDAGILFVRRQRQEKGDQGEDNPVMSDGSSNLKAAQ